MILRVLSPRKLWLTACFGLPNVKRGPSAGHGPGAPAWCLGLAFWLWAGLAAAGGAFGQPAARPCDDFMAYAPLVPEHTPVKRVRLTFHVLCRADGQDSFAPDQASRDWLLGPVLWGLNHTYANLRPMRLESPSPHIPDSRIQFVVDTLLFHVDDQGWDMSPDPRTGDISYQKGQDLYRRHVLENPALGPGRDSSVHVFLGEHDRSKGIASGIGDKRWVVCASFHHHYLQGNHWIPAGNLRHELGHSIGLTHSWNAADGCADTPPNRNCWNGAECSNNIMDYNAEKGALTACQLGRAHYYLSGRQGSIAEAVAPDHCRYDGSRVVIAAGDSVVWEGQKRFAGDIVVEPGATLVVRCPVHLPRLGTLRLLGDARLVLDGGSLTNLCGESWGGIRGNRRNVSFLDGGRLENTRRARPRGGR